MMDDIKAGDYLTVVQGQRLGWDRETGRSKPMGRHGYTDDCGDNWATICWRGRVASATRGKRGQKMLRDLLEALDAMPEKALIRDDLVTKEGDCCAMGALLLHRGVEDPQRLHEDNESLAAEVDVAECLVREIEWENDEGSYLAYKETPEDRWKRMRAWVKKQIKEEPDAE